MILLYFEHRFVDPLEVSHFDSAWSKGHVYYKTNPPVQYRTGDGKEMKGVPFSFHVERHIPCLLET